MSDATQVLDYRESAKADSESAPTRNRWLILALVCIAQFMVVLDATIVNVALPSIKTGLNFSAGDLQWVVNAYALIFGGFLLLGGRAADLFGRQTLFLIGIAIFSFASLVNGLATSSGMLIGGRALQGLGAAFVSPAALSIITTSFSEGQERARALAVWSAIAAGGGAFGLLLGGVLTQTLSWEWCFFVNIPIGIAAFLLSLKYVPNTKAPGVRGRLDLGGAVTVTAGLVVLVYGIVEAQSAGWLSARTIGLFSLSAVLFATFVGIERRFEPPLIRLDLFRSRSLTGGNVAMLFAAAGLFGMFFFASLYVQTILGYSPLKAGLAFLPVTAGIIVGAGLAQNLVRRFGVRTLALVGMPLAAIGLLSLVTAPVTGTYLRDLLPGFLTLSIGMGLTFVPLTLIATTGVKDSDAGLASGLFNTSQQVGGALGLAILSTISASRTSDWLTNLGHAPSSADQASALLYGFHTAFLVAAIMLAVGAVLLAFTVRRRHVVAVDELAAAGAIPEAQAA
jgi:EmrB/QacA subfamily drug resistance transporter